MTGAVSYVLVRQYIISSNLNDLMAKAQIVSNMIARPGGETRVLTLEGLRGLQSLSDATYIYVDADRNARRLPVRTRRSVRFGTEPDVQYFEVIESLDEQLLETLLQGSTAYDVRKLDFISDQVLFAGAPIVNIGGKVTGAVILYRPLREVSAMSQRILSLFSIAGAFAVGGAACLAWIISRRFTRPLIALNRTAGHIAEGHYGERAPISDIGDEIGQLGMTLNLLSERLYSVIKNLTEEKTKLEKVLTSIGEGVIAVDREGRAVHYNTAALELLGIETWSARSHMETRLNQQDQLLDMLSASIERAEKGQTHWKNPSGRVVEAVSSPLINPDGTIIGAVCLLRDISEAERLEQMRRDYIANISHELRTPLTGIRGMVEPLLDGYMDTEEEKRDCYDVIYQETMRLEKLIGEMLDLSRLQDGRISIELEPMDPVALQQEAARRLRDRAKEAGIFLTVEQPQHSLLCMGNENRILQVLIILLDNALSFTPSGGSITLRTRCENEWIVLEVTDTGAGIDPMDLPYIWERFYKADKSRMRTSGTGLGLSIAKLAVELMGGSIDVKTEVGKGSTFIFTLKNAS